MRILRSMAVVVMTFAFGLALPACDDADREPTRTTRDVEVDDKLLGGKEIKETEVIQQGDRTQVRERETDIDDEGRVEEQKVEIKGDTVE